MSHQFNMHDSCFCFPTFGMNYRCRYIVHVFIALHLHGLFLYNIIDIGFSNARVTYCFQTWLWRKHTAVLYVTPDSSSI